ncbi:hypothetical protein ACQ4LE_003314 [Meloidogyne hapla]
MSIIWSIGLFEKLSSTKALCIECKSKGLKCELELPKSSVKSLKTHLFSKLHEKSEFAEKYKMMEEKKDKSQEKQSKITDVLATSSGNISSFDKKVMNFIASTNNAFNIVNNTSFKSLVYPNVPKSDTFYRQTCFAYAYTRTKAIIEEEISKWQKVSLTCDAWSGPVNNFFWFGLTLFNIKNNLKISLTVHGITKKWSLKSYVLAVSHFPGTHSSNAIAEMIQKILNAWKIG